MSFDVGDIHISTLVDGEIRVPAHLAYPKMDADAWAPHRRWLDHDGNVVLPFGAFLVRTGQRLVLVDTGAGRLPKAGFKSGALIDELRRSGVSADDVTDVVLTHLHWDHVGWTTQQGAIVFPNAAYRCDSADWEYFRHDEKTFKKVSPFAGQLETWSGSATLAPGIDTLPTPGHTPGHAGIVVSSGEERAVILGDAAHCPLELEETELDGIGDVDPEAARKTREWIAARLEASGEPAVAPHFPFELGRIVRVAGVRRWVVRRDPPLRPGAANAYKNTSTFPLSATHREDIMAGTVVELFRDTSKKFADKVAFQIKVDDGWVSRTWGDYANDVRAIAGGLRSLGVDREDKVAILSQNRPEWVIADIATQTIGAVTVPIYVTNSPPQVSYITGHSEAKVIVLENEGQLQKVLERKHELPNLMKAVVIDAAGVKTDGFAMSYADLLKAGEAFNTANPKDVDEHASAVKPDDLATLVYTSGTTGPPKGAMLTHANIVWTCKQLHQVLEAGADDRRLSYLPLSHIAERMTSHFLGIYQGSQTWFAQSIDTLAADLRDCRPTVFFGVPRVWEKFYAGIAGMLDTLPAEQKDMAEQALQLGLKRVEATQAGTSLPPELEAKYQEADGKLFALARGALGLDQARAMISGAAPINPEVLRFFHAIGLPVAEVYGQTEDNGPTSINRPDKIKIGTVGPALPGVQVKIAEDGEILVKGGNVGPGYYKDPLATEQLIDKDGWMHSGDIGVLDDEGYLTITDRKKDLIITAAGKNIAPQVIENMLKYSPWISQVVVIGDRRPYLTAIVTLDQEKVTQFAQQKSIPFTDFAELTRHPDIQHLIEVAVQEVNKDLARVEQIKKWTILERDFLQEAEEITPTLKVRRKAITEMYTDTIEQMYA